MSASEQTQNSEQQVIVQFQSVDGEHSGPPLSLPTNVTPEVLRVLINKLLLNDEELSYAFYVDGDEVVDSLQKDIIEKKSQSAEDTIVVVYHPQARFRVRPVSHCSSSMPGHSESILCASFSPDSSQLASGSGDTTVRIWDLNTETPQFTCKGHTNWVMCVSWSPDGKTLASGGMDGTVRLWNPTNGKEIGGPLKGHSKYITGISWEPLHLNPDANRLVSSSKDGTVRIWDTKLRRTIASIAGHTNAVACIQWGGDGKIYTGSRDKTIKIWNTDGTLWKTLNGHAHWVNSLTLSTDFVLRTGAHDPVKPVPENKKQAQVAALERYEEAVGGSPVRLVTGSDDFTMYLWDPVKSNKPIARLTGHQKLVNHVAFSPDSRFIASGSFDNSVKLWDGYTGKFITSLRGHVAAVYRLAWSSDSRMLVSSSKDSTVILWDIRTKKLLKVLPGHQSENAGGNGSNTMTQTYQPIGEQSNSTAINMESQAQTGPDENIFKKSSHPFALAFLFLFKITALTLYLLGNFFTDSFILIFVICVLCLSFDFWTVKNISGRLLVGLRWWNQVHDDGTSNWVFESRDSHANVNASDSRTFWTVLYATPVVWALLAIAAFFSLRFQWLLIVVIAIVLSSANLIGYSRCDKDAKRRLGQLTGQSGGFGIPSMMTNFITSHVTNSIFNRS
ncbi:ribosome assembly [Mycoemilia scoparia]|uniref:Ribosome assembly n=1 Tax=Mycoemilia scoparia TaxID=417184 RepID=A0A9W8DK34_9FUNG|nr:ribosome assembly [Mycoemilia scoparia]